MRLPIFLVPFLAAYLVTSNTHAMRPLNPEIVGGECVPTQTVSLSGSLSLYDCHCWTASDASVDVDFVSNGIEMVGVDTGANATGMVKLKSGRHGAEVFFVRDAMRKRSFPLGVTCDFAIAILVEVPHPNPATRFGQYFDVAKQAREQWQAGNGHTPIISGVA